MENRLIVKVDVDKRFHAINKRIQEKREAYSRLKDQLNEAVKRGDLVDHFTSQLASLDLELQALGEALADIESERNEFDKFLKSKEADKLRKRLNELEVDYKKRYKVVQESLDALINGLNSLFEALVEYDDVRKALGQGRYYLLGFLSITREKPYNYLFNLKNSIDQWIRGAKSLGIDWRE